MGRGRKLPVFLIPEEQEQLLAQFNIRYVTPHRDRTMILLALHSGLRLSELTHLEWDDIDLRTGQLDVRAGKGAKDRLLWISAEVVEGLSEWRKRQTEEWGPYKLVFPTRTGNHQDGSGVRKMIARYTKRAGINKHVTTHTLRHTFATDLLRDSSNIRIVQRALGHDDIQTTQIYTHIIDSELEDAMKTFKK